MKRIELSILDRDADRVIEYLGRQALLHLADEEAGPGADGMARVPPKESVQLVLIREKLEALRSAAAYLGIHFPEECGDSSTLPGEDEAALADRLCAATAALSEREGEFRQEKAKVEETLHEVKAFENLSAPFRDLDQLSFLTLRVGRLDPRGQELARESLGDRALIIPLGKGGEGTGERVLAAASRKGRFALDSELKKYAFMPIAVPEDFKGVPSELIAGLEGRLGVMAAELEQIQGEKTGLRDEAAPMLKRLAAAFLLGFQVEQLKGRLKALSSVYVLSGWVPAEELRSLATALESQTGGRVAIRAYDPEELPGVREGREKVPVSLDHGAFVRGFEGVVFSYGAPLYGTIDPTPFVAFFFTLLFGIMFGDLGQGLVLLLLGLFTGKKGLKALAGFRSYSTPLRAVVISSMVMGLLTGSVFTNEDLLKGPTKAVTGFFMGLFGIPGAAPEKILQLMPEKESMDKLFYFFGFTIAVGVVLNSIGLIVNIVNLWTLKRREKALFSKTGAAGLILFWYAISMAVRIMLNTGSAGTGTFAWFDLVGLLVPVFCIFFGPVLWRLLTGKRPVLEEGLMVFIMEGFVEVLETASTYISNTVSFLRVGAFALSHAVLSFIVFTLSGLVAGAPVGPVLAFVIMIVGNAVIIALEGMIVAIQVVRLQYYEFFSKFFTETGVEYRPFRFNKTT
jgi:V/A-type H+-transporting ATPase subunit I